MDITTCLLSFPLLLGALTAPVVQRDAAGLGTLPIEHQVSSAEQVPLGAKIGDLRFKDIRYLPRSITEFGPHEAYVFVFTTNSCPLVARYMPRLIGLHARYGDKVQFVGVNVGADDTISGMAAFALDHGAEFPFVKDTDGSCVAALGVQRTPEVAVLDGGHTLVYRGRIDDQYRLGGVLPRARRSDLEAALDEVLAGRAVTVPTTPVDGCQITRVERVAVTPGSITYHGDVAPLMRSRCVTCHRPGAPGPFSLTNYRQVRSEGAMIAEVVGEGRMPPWYASPSHGTFTNDPSLGPDQRQVIVDWVRSGMPEGAAPSEPAAPLAPSPKWSIGEPDLVLSMLLPHRLPSDGFVDYRYVVLPHIFAEDTWVEALEILPDNKRVVHHANLAYAAPGHSAGASTFITGYVPGGQALDLARLGSDVAFRIPPGSVLGLQIHYVTTGRPETSRVAVGLRFKRGAVSKQLRFHMTDPHRFKIPAHAPAAVIKRGFNLKEDASVLGLFAHMHLRGKDVTFAARRPDGTSETLLQIPNYSFDWQLGYEIEPGAKRFPKGTRISVTAHYDNSFFNPYNPDPEREVGFGLQTVDEMMNAYVAFTYDDEDLGLSLRGATGRELSGAEAGAVGASDR